MNTFGKGLLFSPNAAKQIAPRFFAQVPFYQQHKSKPDDHNALLCALKDEKIY